MTTATLVTGTQTMETAARETELRACGEGSGLTMRELAAKMGVSAGYLWVVAHGAQAVDPEVCARGRCRSWRRFPDRRSSIARSGVVSGESSYIRERARRSGHEYAGPSPACGGVLSGYMDRRCPAVVAICRA